MARSSVQRIVKGDIIIERVNGKKRMTPVKQVEFNACSSHGVHVNRSMCYEYNAVVDLVDSEGSLGDLEKEFSGLGDLEGDFPTVNDLWRVGMDSVEGLAEKLIKA